MDEKFFTHICEELVGIELSYDVDPFLYYQRCSCDGRDYKGMPKFDIEAINGDSSDSKHYY